ncbi:MAG: bifunctional DNA-formamidopyrimidine glycosylase/DNA-(apurinic or apyrimidinic site) lyase [Planctomycetes bacterium]|nr:bifunctional DNA-formamidopyrimidine glycosylase/DNA-(apurinic or apyrimidinic site) lyase [Planctomycetota bacterium]
MPELPEVETTRRGVAAHLVGKRLLGAEVRNPKLRQPVPADLTARLAGVRVRAVERRAKYLLVRWQEDSLLLHLGMSGSLRIVRDREAPGRHDHFDLLLPRQLRLRYRDPRRFGLALLAGARPELHPLLRDLGPEPLEPGFSGETFVQAFRGRRASVKQLLLDGGIVAGVGNIYACEALFLARVRPSTPAGKLSAARCGRLATAVREVLQHAVDVGGTTLRDFVGAEGEPGYFQHELAVYGRAGLPCRACGGPIQVKRLGQRSTFSCGRCQR